MLKQVRPESQEEWAGKNFSDSVSLDAMRLVREQGNWRLGLGLRGQMLGILALMMVLVVIIFPLSG